FRYGNFNQYYRRGPFQEDPRISLLCDDWFTGKRVLDLGCSNGTLTLSIARAFSPSRIVGVDIDPVLIKAARQTHRLYIDKEKKLIGKFPASFALNFGPVSTTPTTTSAEFPYNVSFEARNYVFNHDGTLDKVEEEYDVCLAFSLTKWVHLNFGDDGLKRFFKRVYRNLRPGGRFILETQRYDSYRKHRRVHPEMEANYARMRFFPESFHDYLLSEEVGFKHVEDISSPLSISLGCWKLEAYYKSELLVPPAADSDNAVEPTPRVQWNDPTRSPLDTEAAVNYELSLTPNR
ncbi:Protein Y17G7B.18 a, partial [Aphelenchoides avenae]